MSQNVSNLIPVLDGSNYGIWSKAMKAYLMSVGLWGHVSNTVPMPDAADFPDAAAFATANAEWTKHDNMAMGHMILRVNASIQQEVANLNFADTVWNRLLALYGVATPTTVYKDFKAALSIRINPSQHPGPQIDVMVAAFQRLTASSIVIPQQIQAMMLLAALPQKWEMLVSIVTQNYDLNDIELSHVRDGILAQYESETTRHGHGQGKGKQQQHAKKLSAVKRKRGDPSFSNQQKGDQQQEQGDKPYRQRGQRGKGKGKGKPKDQGHAHSHIANIASLPVPSSSTIASIGPSGLEKRTVAIAPPKERTPGPYKALNEAFDLADRIGVTPTIQTVKTLEERITQQYMDGPWSKSTYHLSDDEGSDIVDMSIAPPGHEGQDEWAAFQEEEPVYNPATNDDEPLDWGSDLEDTEACVHLTPHLPLIHNLTVSHQPQRGLRPCMDGSCSYAYPTDTFFNYKCEHDDSFALCAKCKGKSHWLLDSGASAHFTYDKNDFIEYEDIPTNERIPVGTASNVIYVKGKGTVLLKHYMGDEAVTTRLYPVLYIPEITHKLLSMGEFLQQGQHVAGNAYEITLFYKKYATMTCKPLKDGQTVYWLDTTVAKIGAHQLIYTVDYDLMHRRLGHPSRDVMSQTRKNTKGFPDKLHIPSTTPVCPGCAQGKMPASAHPPSETRAKAPFERIHSDLKSFPVVSYHKYKYFVSFIDDYTSYAWIVCLREKSAAILALKQFMAYVKNQHNANIKEWMSDAGGEYKSDAFLKTLKDAGIKILQSAPHTPQQNGRAERFMRTVMDKAQAMRLEACIPQSWWEFAVLHALHCYNRTPLRRHKWQTPYTVLHGEAPDISHLRVFGCGAYVHIPKETRINALSPKSELMVYLGHTEGIKASTFMRMSNNTLFTSTTALFDETIFPKCPNERIRGTTRVNEPRAHQPPIDATEDTTPGDLDTQPPAPIKGEAPEPDGASEAPDDEEPTEQLTPPPAPEPVPLRRSDRLRKIPTRPGNVYGDSRHPTSIEKDVRKVRTWRQMTDNQPGSSGSGQSSGQHNNADPPSAPSDPLPTTEEDEIEDLLRLAKEGGVKYLDQLLAKAVPPTDLESPDTANIREWTFRDILKMPNTTQKEWKQACREELESLRRRKVFELVDPPKGRKVIRNRWVFDLKTDGRKKARLVAKGFSQVEGVDYDEIFSPVVRFETVRMMVALAALKNWHITGLDVKTAFLYGELDEELYMEQPEGFKIKGQERKVMRLKRAIYGLKQAALAWWKALDKSMDALGLTRLQSDSGLFVNKAKTIVAIVYVDDVLFLGADKPKLLRLKEQFMKAWECRDLGDAQEFLRMRIKRKDGKIYLDQTAYLQKVLQRFELQNAKSVPTPLPEGYNPSPNTSQANPALRSKFQQVIGSLLYIMLGTRPDIAFAVTKLSQHAANPSEDHLNRALYICRYLLGSADYSLVFDGPSNGGLMAYADSDWASDPTTRKSTTGYMIKLAGAIFSWNSRAQKTVALSSTEAEYMSLSDTSRQLIWVKSLMSELGIELAPIPLFGDNQGSIFLASNPVQEKRIKHIDLRYHFIRDVIKTKQVELFFVEGTQNTADLFTKNLGRIKFLKFREQLGLEFYSPK